VAFLLTKQTWKFKAIGIFLPFLLLVPFIVHSRNEAYKITGTRQFSLFTGWQLANNALYIYDQIEVDSTQLPTAESRELNRLALSFIKHYNSPDYRPYLESYVGNYFIRQPESPLKRFYYRHYNNAYTEFEVNANWGKASAQYEPFGRYIISHNPIIYARYFMWPNTFHYFLPPLSHIEIYNYGLKDIDPIAQTWFHYSKPEVHCFSPKFQGFLIIYEAFFLVANLFYVLRFFAFIRRNRLAPFANPAVASYYVTTCFLLINFVFSVFTTLNILRYQIVPMLLLLSFCLLTGDYLEQYASDQKKKKNSNVAPSLLTPAEINS
jgi:hypothetical protein